MKKRAGMKIMTIAVFGLCILFVAAMVFISALYAVEIFRNAGSGIIQTVF